MEQLPRGVASVGRWACDRVADLGSMAFFLLRILLALVRPPIRARLAVDEGFKLGVLSVTVVCVSGLFTGMVLGLQGYNTLVRFGAEDALGTVVALALIRELGPVLTALLVAGRAGSAAAAEIGSMVTSEQMDGLRMMAVDPVDYVAAPKLVAMTGAMPLLTALFIVCGLGGGYLVGVGMMGVDAGNYMSRMISAVEFHDDVGGCLIKSLVFGGLVGLVATHKGYRAEPTAAGVSAAATSTVVFCSVSVLILDYIITALWGP